MNMREVNESNETVGKIVESAIELFNSKGYVGASISDISKQANLSKGLLYHYFKNKDELYLYCANLCIEEYIKYLDQNLVNPIESLDAIAENVKVRILFFNEYPKFKTLFHFIVARKPSHLAQELVEIRKKLSDSNEKRFKEIISNIELGKGVKESDIITFTAILQNSSSYLLEEEFEEEKRKEQIEIMVHLVKIFINGLKEDVI